MTFRSVFGLQRNGTEYFLPIGEALALADTLGVGSGPGAAASEVCVAHPEMINVATQANPIPRMVALPLRPLLMNAPSFNGVRN